MTRNYDDDDDDDLFNALQSMEPCANCGKEGAKVPCMSGCNAVFYCSQECGMHHASQHRLCCRNARFNGAFEESDSSSSDDEEEYETDSSYDDDTGSEESEEEEEEQPKKRSNSSKREKRKSGRKGKRPAAPSGDGEVMVSSEVERRIEEKIMRRWKKQEENRIAQAIEERMRTEKAGWLDDDMMRFMMELRERFATEMSSSQFIAQVKKRGGDKASADMMGRLQNAVEAMPPPSANPQAEEKETEVTMADGVRSRSVSKESSWNNMCREFAALRVVVWKHSFLPRMEFKENPKNGIWNAIKELDADESFGHITEGDALLSVNGRVIDEAVKTDGDLKEVFDSFASPLILKFEAADPDNGRVHDYAVTWRNGPLGVTLKDDATNQKVPIVNRLTKKPGSVAVKQNIAIGDVLVAINNIDTIQLGCSLSMSILKKVQLPAKLRFRGVGGPPPGSSPDAEDSARESISLTALGNMKRPSSYEVTWGEGPLGLTIIPGAGKTDLPIIKKVTGTGTSPGIEMTQIGDLLESMNGKSTAGMPFDQVVGYLKATPKPIHLRFKAGGDESTPSPRADPSPPKPSREAKAPSPQRSSPSKPAASQPPPVSHQNSSDEYHIVWGEGPLGLTIDGNPHSSGSYIKRIANQGAAASLSSDCIGDLLIFINDRDVSRAPFTEVVGMLKNLPRPVTLRFRRKQRPSSTLSQSVSSLGSAAQESAAYQNRMSDTPTRGRKPSAHEANGIYYYNVVWQAGTPLGLSLRGADSTSEYPYITKVTGSGSAAHLPSTVANDCLISVDGRSVHKRDKSFDEVMSMLKNMPKPITLKFQTRNDSNPSRPVTSGDHQQQHRQPQPQQQQYQQPQQQQYVAPQQANMAPPPMQNPPLQSGPSWRQNRGGQMGASVGPPPPMYQSSSLPQSRAPMPSSRQNSNGMSRSFMNQNEQAHGLGMASGHDDKFSSIQAPFLAQSQISTTRRKKMLKGLKK